MCGPRARWRTIPGRRVMVGGVAAAVVLLVIAVALTATNRGEDTSQVAGTGTSIDTEATPNAPTPPSSAPTTSAPAPDDPRPTSTEAEQPSTSASVEVTGVLGRHDAAPPGVAEQFEYYDIGDPPCSAYAGAENPTVALDMEPAFVLRYVSVCVAGFDVSSPIQVTVVASDGSAVAVPPHDPTDRGAYEGVVVVSFIPDLMAPTGDWTATAVQGELMASATFRVVQPAGGLVRVVPDSGTPGTDFRLELAGFAPGQPATVDVYRADDGVMRYVTSIETSPTDELGRAEHTLVTSPSDPAVGYCFLGRGAGRDGGCPAESGLLLG